MKKIGILLLTALFLLTLTGCSHIEDKNGAEIDIDGNDEICIENADGVYTIVIGGESAEFAFTYTYRLTNLPE